MDDTTPPSSPAASASHLADRVVVITGAGGGFGRLVAHMASARGAKVVAADIDGDGLAETAAQADGEVTTAIADVTDRTQMQALATTAVETYGAIDVMINNAGIMPLAFWADHDQAADAWDRCIDINIKGVVNGITAVHDQMITQGRGHVVNIASIYGNHPVPGAAIYGMSKAAVIFLSDALRQESQGRIKVTTVRPTGVPGTGLGGGIVNPAAISGILGTNEPAFMEALGALMGEQPPQALADPTEITYASLAPELLAEQIMYAIDQPWGVTISDVTVRAAGDLYQI